MVFINKSNKFLFENRLYNKIHYAEIFPPPKKLISKNNYQNMSIIFKLFSLIILDKQLIFLNNNAKKKMNR